MKDILLSLYKGEPSPAEQCSSEDGEYRKICEAYYRECSELREILSRLNPPLDKQFTAITDKVPNITDREAAEMFVCGFRLGARLMIDVLSDNKD